MGVAHLAFIHDFSKYQANIDTDKNVITALTDALAGTGKPLVTTFGVGLVAPGRTPYRRRGSQSGDEIPEVPLSLWRCCSEGGIRASFIRLPPTVHGRG